MMSSDGEQTEDVIPNQTQQYLQSKIKPRFKQHKWLTIQSACR